jgi:hypothetical protein
MAEGYTRQSTFIDGDIILAEHGNLEFDKLVNAFDSTTGHTHDGTSDGGAAIPFIIDETGAQDITLTPTGVTGSVILDQDTLSSNSAIHLATQQSIKAYVDTEITGSNTYTDGEIVIAKAYTDTAEADANTYTDGEIVIAKAYTDTEIAAVTSASEIAAGVSADAAAVSETNAATSEANASTSETNAAASEAIASAAALTTATMSKEYFFALAEKRIDDSAGSGFAEWGKSQSYNKPASVNEGMWAAYTDPNKMRMGRGYTDAEGISRTNTPRALVNGVYQNLDVIGVGADAVFNNAVVNFPNAPDGTKSYDSATGIVTQHASAAEAFEGLLTNGDFRDGTTGWAVNYYGTGTGSVSNGEVTFTASDYANRAQWSQLISTTIGETYRIEYVCTQHANSGTYVILEEDNVGTIIHQLQGTGVGYLEFTSISNTNTRITIRGQAGTSKFSSISVLPATEQVITSRQDFVFLESWAEAITDKDVVYPLGNVQYGTTSYEGITLATNGIAQGYSAFGEWDTATTGNCVVWSTLTAAEQKLFIEDHDNNIYSDGDALIQMRYRVRVIEGLGDEWSGVNPNSLPTLQYNAQSRIQAQATNATPSTWTATESYLGLNSTRTSLGDKANGSFVARDSRTGGSHEGLCFAVPIALVQRRNQGGYHPSYNPNGCKRVRNIANSSDVTWDNYPDAAAYTSLSSCFDLRSPTEAGYITGLSGYISSSKGSGRPDGKFYDSIYASDVDDLRMSSRRVPVRELREHYKRKAIAGEVRGYEGVPFTNVFVAGETISLTTTPYSLKLVESKVLGDTSWIGSSNTPCVGNVILSGVVHKITQAKIAGGDVFLVSPTFAVGGEVGAQVLQAAVGQVSLHKQANPTWTDILGDPANIAATFPDGVEGQWVPEIPNGSTKDYKFTRKIEATVARVFTENNGTTWSTSGVTINSSNNNQTIFLAATHVGLYHYETQAHFTEDDVNSEVLDLGEVYVTSASSTQFGNVLQSSLTGKIGTAALGNSLESANVGAVWDYVYLANELSTVSNSYPKHRGINSDNLGGNTTKTLDYLSEQDGVGKLCYAYKEMKHDVDWGDNNEFEILDSQGTQTDDNGNDILYGTASFNTQYFIVEE